MRLVTWLAVVLVGTATAEATNPKIVGKAPVKPAPKPAVKPPKPGVQKPTSAANGKPASQTPVVVVTKSSAGPVKPSASKTTSASSKTSSACLYQGYTPKADSGPKDESAQRRSVAGRAVFEKRALNNVPKQFGNCVVPPMAAGLKYRNNPTVDNVLGGINQAGTIPKWFTLNTDCKTAPALVVIGDDPARKEKVDTVTANGRTISIPKFNVDHVWELKLMERFFASLLPGPNNPSATLTCADFEASFIDPGAQAANQPLQKLYNLMPQALDRPNGTPNTLEFTGTSVELNAKKARILTPKQDASSLFGFNHNASLQNIKDKIHALRTVGTTLAMMNDNRVTPLFERAQSRLKAYMTVVDSRISAPASAVTLSKAGFQWDAAFESWMKMYLSDRSRETWTWVRDMMGEVQKEIKKMPEKTQAEKDRKAQHQRFLYEFEKSAFGKQAHYTIRWSA